MKRATAKLIMLALVLCTGGSQAASIVQTAQSRLTGELSFRDGGLKIAETDVPWADVLYLISNGAGSTLPSPDAIRFANGERWACAIKSIRDGKIEIETQLLGARTVAAADVSVLEFAPVPDAHGDVPRTLYRTSGEPVPGALVGFDGRQLQIDTQLGVLSFDRNELSRYVLREGPASPPAGDEVVLVDGTILKGEAVPAADGFDLRHAVLGDVKLPADAIVSILRHTSRMTCLAERAPDAVNAVPLIARAIPPVRIGGDPAGRFIRAILLRPKSEARYKLTAAGGKMRLVATIMPMDGCTGVVHLRIRCDAKVMFEKDVPPGSAPEPVSIELPAGGEITFDADFGPGLRFPLGVLIGDPIVIAE